jgi:carboxymethylenebutenolidase
MGDFTRLNAMDGAGSFAAYEAGGGSAGIVVIQEIFGINAGIRAMVDNWATLGYHAIAPDLFWRQEHGVELDADVPEDLQRAFGFFERFDGTKAVVDIEAAIKLLRSKGCSKVGVIGYCLGGYLAYLSAARTDSDASIGYYGVSIDTKLDEQHAIGKPLMLHIATADGFVPAAAQAAIHAALNGNRHVTIHDYDADHAFARHSGSSRVPALAEIADARSRDFFAAHLR